MITRKIKKDGLIHLVLKNSDIRIVVLPEIGGKIIEITHLKTGRQFLLTPQNIGSIYKRPSYGAPFENFDTSGFDECFPTVEISKYCFTENGKTTTVIFPDHGEVWSVPWDYSIQDDFLKLNITGTRFPYQLQKKIFLKGKKIIIHYQLYNFSSSPLSYIWSAHPLLKVEEGDQIILNKDVNRVLLNWSSNPELGKFGDILSWPNLNQEENKVDHSVVQKKSYGWAIKCFTNALSKGYAAVYFQKTGESLIMEFEPSQIPYLGLWLCYGGWPVDSSQKHHTIALEPCSGRPDSLSVSILRKENSVVEAKTQIKWQLTFKITEDFPTQIGNS